jgi:ABC-type nitrate/sulfonate/bicarbonate transport system substrate-binding protein
VWPVCADVVPSGSDCARRAKRRTFKLALDWYPNANHLGLFIAQERAIFGKKTSP